MFFFSLERFCKRLKKISPEPLRIECHDNQESSSVRVESPLRELTREFNLVNLNSGPETLSPEQICYRVIPKVIKVKSANPYGNPNKNLSKSNLRMTND